jgi:hypothetical protein
VPGQIAKIVPHKQWSYAGHSYLSGQILSTRLDVARPRTIAAGAAGNLGSERGILGRRRRSSR